LKLIDESHRFGNLVNLDFYGWENLRCEFQNGHLVSYVLIEITNGCYEQNHSGFLIDNFLLGSFRTNFWFIAM